MPLSVALSELGARRKSVAFGQSAVPAQLDVPGKLVVPGQLIVPGKSHFPGSGTAPVKKISSLFILLALAPFLAACVTDRPTGDFGRPEPSLFHDFFAAKAGDQAIKLRTGPVSNLNYTDKELELRDRAWTLVRPAHARDWLGNSIAEGQRSRILPDLDNGLSKERYYRFLRSDQFASSDARYERVRMDLTADRKLLHPYCALAYDIRTIDQERLRAADARVSLKPSQLQNIYARVEENRRLMSWVWRSVKYRALSYDYAIDALELETPSDRLFDTRISYREYLGAISECEVDPDIPVIPIAEAPKSRLVEKPKKDYAAEPEVVPQK